MTGFRQFRISEQMLLEVFAPGDHPRGYRVTKDGVPPDARIVGEYRNTMTHELVLTLASDAWEPTEHGAAIKTLDTLLETL